MVRTLARCILSLTLMSCPTRADEILKTDGRTITRVTIKETNLEEVLYSTPAAKVVQRLPAGRVRRILYTRSRVMRRAQDLMDRGSWRDAIPYFKKAGKEPGLEEAAAFGMAKARYRLSDETGTDPTKAIEELEAYLEEYRQRKGFHVPGALYLLGEAHLTAGSIEKAADLFGQVAGFSGDTRRLRSHLGTGLVHLARNEVTKAATIFKTVLTQARRANLAEIYRQAAAYRGRALVADKRAKEAIFFLEDHVKGAGSVLDRYMAQAYNALGDAYQAAGGSDNQWEALYRYLWTTVVFRASRKECAEAFTKAVELSRQLGEAEEAERLHAIFTREFGDTAWAKQREKAPGDAP